jgi:hypothetical protein
VKKLLLITEAVTGLSALICGGLLVTWPDGSAIGLPLFLLETSPFDNFFIPGLILALVVGGSQLMALLTGISNLTSAGRRTLIAGILLTGWIIIQVIMIRGISWLHLVFAGIGLFQIIYGIKKSGKMKALAGCDIL